MSAIEVRPIRGHRERRTFLTFPWRIYRDDPLWVPPLLPERAKTIDPQRGAFFKRGEAEFFVAWRDGKPAGTICAADDKPTNEFCHTQDCMFGFFECVQDDAVAEALFHQAIAWAERRGLNALFGPFNLDYEDSHGLLVEGRDRPPVLLCGHNPPYYPELLTRFGFQQARADKLAYAVDLGVNTLALQRLSRLADRIRKRKQFVVRGADLEHWEDEVERVYGVINLALAHLPGFMPWHREALRALVEPFRRIADPELILFAEVEGKTVGWFPGVANLNEALQYANGLRYPWDALKLWWHARRQPECLTIKSVLVLPEYWNTGVSVLLFDEMAQRARARGFKWIDLSLTSEDNPATPVLAEQMGGQIYKRYRIYRLGF